MSVLPYPALRSIRRARGTGKTEMVPVKVILTLRKLPDSAVGEIPFCEVAINENSSTRRIFVRHMSIEAKKVSHHLRTIHQDQAGAVQTMLAIQTHVRKGDSTGAPLRLLLLCYAFEPLRLLFLCYAFEIGLQLLLLFLCILPPLFTSLLVPMLEDS